MISSNLAMDSLPYDALALILQFCERNMKHRTKELAELSLLSSASQRSLHYHGSLRRSTENMNDTCLPLLYRHISAKQLLHPALATTLASKPHYASFVKEAHWAVDLDCMEMPEGGTPRSVQYLISRYIDTLESSIAVLRLFTQLTNFGLTLGQVYVKAGDKEPATGYVSLTERPQLPSPLAFQHLRSITVKAQHLKNCDDPRWELLFWLITSSPASKLDFQYPLHFPSEPPCTTPFEHVEEISLSLREYEIYGMGKPESLLVLCPALRKINLNFGTADMFGLRICIRGTRNNQDQKVWSFQKHLDLIGHHKSVQSITHLSIKNLQSYPVNRAHLNLRQFFPSCTHLQLHYAASYSPPDNPSDFGVTLIKLLSSTPRPALTSVVISLKAALLARCQLSLFADQQLFPSLRRLLLVVTLHEVTSTAKALGIPEETEDVVAEIQQVLSEDFRLLVKSFSDETEVEIRYDMMVLKSGRQGLVFTSNDL